MRTATAPYPAASCVIGVFSRASSLQQRDGLAHVREIGERRLHRRCAGLQLIVRERTADQLAKPLCALCVAAHNARETELGTALGVVPVIGSQAHEDHRDPVAHRPEHRPETGVRDDQITVLQQQRLRDEPLDVYVLRQRPERAGVKRPCRS